MRVKSATRRSRRASSFARAVVSLARNRIVLLSRLDTCVLIYPTPKRVALSVAATKAVPTPA